VREKGDDEVSFYMLYLEGGGAPTFKHEGQGAKVAAKAEAERLARAHPGRRVHMLRSVGSVIKSDVRWSGADEEPSDDIPF
jgi:hypothetical protein